MTFQCNLDALMFKSGAMNIPFGSMNLQFENSDCKSFHLIFEIFNFKYSILIFNLNFELPVLKL